MLRVKLLRDGGPAGDPVLRGFTVQGHAGFSDKGQDIVCAGVSAIAQAALFGLKDILGDAVSSEMREGYLAVSVDESRALQEGPRAVFRTLELGLMAVHRSYPGSLILETEEGAKCC